MKAVILNVFGEDAFKEIETFSIPEPSDYEILIKIYYIGLNPADYKTKMGLFGGQLPLILGIDCSGVVEKVGAKVNKLKVGDFVFALCFKLCSNGTYAEYVCVRQELASLKPPNITLADAAALPVITITAYRVMIATNSLNKNITKSILITGASGGVGMLALQLARLKEIENIILLTNREESANFLHSQFNVPKQSIVCASQHNLNDLKKILFEKNNNKLFSSTFDFVGDDIKSLCIEMTAYSGHFSTIVSEDNCKLSKYVDSMFCIEKNLSLHFIFCGAETFSENQSFYCTYQQQFEEIYDLIAEEKLIPPPLQILKGLTVENVILGHQLLKNGASMKKIIIQL